MRNLKDGVDMATVRSTPQVSQMTLLTLDASTWESTRMLIPGQISELHAHSDVGASRIFAHHKKLLPQEAAYWEGTRTVVVRFSEALYLKQRFPLLTY